MKTFLVKLDIRAGEYEKTSICLVEAETAERAGDYAIHGEAHDPESLDWSCGGAYDLGGEFHYSVSSTTELNAVEAKVFLDHLHLYDCSEEELKKSGDWSDTQ